VSTVRSVDDASESSRWRTVDIIVVAMLAVAFGVVFYIWNNYVWVWASGAGNQAASLVTGAWLLPAVVCPLVVRKPGAALFGEVVAAFVAMLLAMPGGWIVFCPASSREPAPSWCLPSRCIDAGSHHGRSGECRCRHRRGDPRHVDQLRGLRHPLPCGHRRSRDRLGHPDRRHRSLATGSLAAANGALQAFPSGR